MAHALPLTYTAIAVSMRDEGTGKQKGDENYGLAGDTLYLGGIRRKALPAQG